MFIKCGVSVQGEDHKRRNIVCQDWNEVLEKDGMVIAAVADGVSSSSHSDMAAQEATKFAVSYCAENMQKNLPENDILAIIKRSFEKTQFHIEQKARELDYELDEIDTTLCLAVFFGGDIYYGYVGDSGIIALREDGIFERVTEIEPDEDGYTYVLGHTDKWLFCKYPHRARSLMLMTDGIWKMLTPRLLENEQYPLMNVYLNFYLNHNGLENMKQEQLDESIRNNITNIQPDKVYHDDKTMVIVIDTEISVKKQDEEYYKWPSEEKWNELQKAYEETIYPYRKTEQNIDNPEENTEKDEIS